MNALHNPNPYRNAWHDKRRYHWLLSVVGPALAASGPAAHFFGATSLFWFYLPLLVFYGLVPLADALLGEDTRNPPDSAVAGLHADPYYRAILYATVPILWATVLLNCIFLATHSLPLGAWLATVVSTGAVLGFGLNVSHEMGHKREWLPRKVALFNTALGGYGHFSIEHNRGHHRYVSTPEDPASARLGENIYAFALREMPGAFLRAWRLEADRLNRRGMARWHWQNEILQAALVTMLLYGGLIAVYGPPMLPVLLLVALWGAFQLTSANYIEHYGLQRRRLKAGGGANGGANRGASGWASSQADSQAGRQAGAEKIGDESGFEACQPHHSWNSNHRVSNLIVFQLQRHSDHHSHPGRSYQALRDFPNLPRLPSGYFGMFLVAYLPPLWFWMMNPRVVQATGGAADAINFVPTKRAALIHRYTLR